MGRKHIVKQGQSPPQIAAYYGFEDWSAIYQHGDNVELRKNRPNPSLIFPGDAVVIPPFEPKVFQLETGKRHRIKIPRPHAKLSLVVKDHEGEPLSGKSFELYLADEDEPVEGSTTGDGGVECEIPLDCETAQLIVWAGDDKQGTRYVWDLALAGLAAPDTDEGVRQRLCNLGYYAGDGDSDSTSDDEDGDDEESDAEEDGEAGSDADEADEADDVNLDPLSLAVASFQEDMGLPVTGEIDDDTRAKLIEAHGGT
jgi:hypothetical protein